MKYMDSFCRINKDLKNDYQISNVCLSACPSIFPHEIN
jgi:hypothetical protein